MACVASLRGGVGEGSVSEPVPPERAARRTGDARLVLLLRVGEEGRDKDGPVGRREVGAGRRRVRREEEKDLLVLGLLGRLERRDGVRLLLGRALDDGRRDAIDSERLVDLVKEVVELDKDEDAVVLGRLLDERHERLELVAKVARVAVSSERLGREEVVALDLGAAGRVDAAPAGDGLLDVGELAVVAAARQDGAVGRRRRAVALTQDVAHLVKVARRAVPPNELGRELVERDAGDADEVDTVHGVLLVRVLVGALVEVGDVLGVGRVLGVGADLAVLDARREGELLEALVGRGVAKALRVELLDPDLKVALGTLHLLVQALLVACAVQPRRRDDVALDLLLAVVELAFAQVVDEVTHVGRLAAGNLVLVEVEREVRAALEERLVGRLALAERLAQALVAVRLLVDLDLGNLGERRVDRHEVVLQLAIDGHLGAGEADADELDLERDVIDLGNVLASVLVEDCAQRGE